MLIAISLLPPDYSFQRPDVAAKKEDILRSEQQQATSGNLLQQALFVGFLAALDLVERCAYDAAKIAAEAPKMLASWLDNEHDTVCQGFIACLNFLDARVERTQAALMRCLADAVETFRKIRQHWLQHTLTKQRDDLSHD